MAFPSLFSVKAICLVLVTLHTHFTTSAALNPANAASIFQTSGTANITDLNAIFNSTTNLDKPRDQFHCAGGKPWTATYKPRDCLWALGFLQNKAAQFGDEPFSWPAVAARGQSKDKYESVNTPTRFRWRSCTLTVALLADAGTLPDAPPPPYSPWEVTSWQAIHEAATELYEVCEIREGKLGWANAAPADFFVGNQLGVFFWATGSEKDRSVPKG